MLWVTATQDMQANAPFQRLRRNPLLLLQLLAVVVFAMAIAKPFLWASGLGGRTTALVLDGTASMRATDEPGSRFAAAIRKATALLSRSVVVIRSRSFF